MFTIKGINKDNENFIFENAGEDMNAVINTAKGFYETQGLTNIVLVDENGACINLNPDVFKTISNNPPPMEEPKVIPSIQSLPGEPDLSRPIPNINNPITNNMINGTPVTSMNNTPNINPYDNVQMEVEPEMDIDGTFIQPNISQPKTSTTSVIDITDELRELNTIRDTIFNEKPTSVELNTQEYNIEEKSNDKEFNIDKEFKEIGKVINYKGNIYIEDENGILREINMFRESKQNKTVNKSLNENLISEGVEEVKDWVFNIQCLDKNDLTSNKEFNLADIPEEVREILAQKIIDYPNNRLYVTTPVEDDYEDMDEELEEDYDFSDNFSDEDIEEEYQKEEDEDLTYKYTKAFIEEEIGNYYLPDEENIMFEDLKNELIDTELLNENDNFKLNKIKRYFMNNLLNF